jgi:hypothetical protein
VEINRQRVLSSADLSEGQRQDLEAALKELSTWMKPSKKPRKPAAPTDVPPLVEVSSEQPPQPDTTHPQSVPDSPGEAQPAQVKRPSLNPFQVVANALKADVRKPSLLETKSIAAMVDEVLQEKLKGGPHETRGIRLLDSPDGGLVVMVGLEKYEGVDAVPDEEIRHAIREAVSEWRERTSKGAVKGEKAGT